MSAPKKSFKWTDAQIAAAVRDSLSYIDVRRALGAAEGGAAHRHVKKRIEDLGLDTSHFDPYRHRNSQRKSQEQVLRKTPAVPPNMGIVRRMFFSLVPYECAGCGNTGTWLDKPLRLHMDHIDGDRTNNVLENLQALCPNCHDQTETWGRGGGSIYGTTQKYARPVSYCDCGVKISKQSKMCQPCDSKRPGRVLEKITWPTDEELIQMLAESNFYALGKKLGVSDNAIRKRMRKRGLLE